MLDNICEFSLLRFNLVMLDNICEFNLLRFNLVMLDNICEFKLVGTWVKAFFCLEYR